MSYNKGLGCPAMHRKQALSDIQLRCFLVIIQDLLLFDFKLLLMFIFLNGVVDSPFGPFHVIDDIVVDARICDFVRIVVIFVKGFIVFRELLNFIVDVLLIIFRESHDLVLLLPHLNVLNLRINLRWLKLSLRGSSEIIHI